MVMCQSIQIGESGSIPTPSLCKKDWLVKPVDLAIARDMVSREHYAKGGSNTGVYILGVCHKNGGDPIAVSWWLPPPPQPAVEMSGQRIVKRCYHLVG